MRKIGFIGMGNMASAITKGIINSGFVKGEDIIAYDINMLQLNKMKEHKLIIASDEREVIENSEMVVIAVKPQILEDVIKPLKDVLKEKALLSIVLGYDFEKYETLVDQSTRHISVMPNTPVQVLKGMTLIEQKNTLMSNELTFVKEMFESIGEIEEVPSHLMGVSGALSGCGPAYIYMVIESLADGAVKEGLPREVAYKLASQTVLGAGTMQMITKTHPGILKDNVCSPGGSTIQGVNALENGGLRAIMMDAITSSLHYK